MRAIQSSYAQPARRDIPVAIYTRVSTRKPLDSCESQAAVCRDFLARHLAHGRHEIACFTDREKGTRAKRAVNHQNGGQP